MNRAVFLDRDGVLVHEPPAYAHRLDQLFMIDGVPEAVRQLNEKGMKVVVVSNQTGVARGLFTENDIAIFNQAMTGYIKNGGGRIDRIYYCPHHPEAVVETYKRMCLCRKPEPGLLLKAAAELEIDLTQSFMIGDKWTDLEAGKRVGCTTVLVKTGLGLGELEKNPHGPADHIAGNLLESLNLIS